MSARYWQAAPRSTAESTAKSMPPRLERLKQIPVEWVQNRGASFSAVIAGLDPAIHPFRKNFDAKKMDPRVKPAGDAAGWARTGLIRPGHALVERI
jgi:hypothetical protein